MGGNFLDGRGNIMVHLGYTDQRGLLSRQRKNTRVDDFDLFQFYGRPKITALRTSPISRASHRRVVSPQVEATSLRSEWPAAALLHHQCRLAPALWVPARTERFHRQFFRTLATPVERWLFAERGHFEITDNISFITEGPTRRRQPRPKSSLPARFEPDHPDRRHSDRDLRWRVATSPLVPAASPPPHRHRWRRSARHPLPPPPSEVGARSAEADRDLSASSPASKASYSTTSSAGMPLTTSRMTERQRSNGQSTS